jgi:2-aminoethylphosphonate-pyruvate transaminase
MSKRGLDAVILAAGRGSRINDISKNVPKGFIEINGQSLINRSIELLQKSEINNIYIVTGYKRKFFDALTTSFKNIYTIYNPNFLSTGSFGSFLKLKNQIKNPFLLLESDLLYDKKILIELINDIRDNIIATSDFTNSGDEVYVKDFESTLVNMSKDKNQFDKHATEFIGISKISIKLFNYLIENYSNKKSNEYEEILVHASRKNKIFVKKLSNIKWCEIDTIEHLNRAKEKVYPFLEQ